MSARLLLRRTLPAFALLLIAQALVLFRRTDSAVWLAALWWQCMLIGPLLFVSTPETSLRLVAVYLMQLSVALVAALSFVESWDAMNVHLRLTNAMLVDSFSVTAAGIGAMLLGALAASARLRRVARRGGAGGAGPIWGTCEFWAVSGAIGLGASRAGSLFSDFGRLGFIGEILTFWPALSVIALDALTRANRGHYRWRYVGWGILAPCRLLADIATGFGAFTVFDATLWALYLTSRRIVRINVPLVLSGVMLIVTAYAARSYVRHVLWVEGVERGTIGTISATISGMSSMVLDGRGNELVGDLLSTRVGYYVFKAHAIVVNETPAVHPFLMGESFRQIWWVFVPRVLYPDKPIAEWGQRFGHDYGFLDPFDNATSFNFPQLTEFYANGGLPLVLVLMFLLGFILRLLAGIAMLIRPRGDMLHLALPLATTFIIVGFGSNLALMINSVLYSSAVLMVPTLALRMVQRGYRAAQRTPATPTISHAPDGRNRRPDIPASALASRSRHAADS